MNPSAIVPEFVIKEKNLLEQAVDDNLVKLVGFRGFVFMCTWRAASRIIFVE